MPKTAKSAGVPLKAAFKFDAAELKTLRRKMRAAIRAKSPEGRVLASHKIGSGRWQVSPAMRKAALAVYESGSDDSDE
jgi:hypothetical protein